MSKIVDDLKRSLDIITVAESYGELIKAGANYKFKDNQSIMINQSKQIFSDFGSGDIKGGSVLDLICFMEKKSIKEGIERLKELNGLETYKLTDTKRLEYKKSEPKEIDFKKLSQYAVLELKSSIAPTMQNECYQIDTLFQKLLETNTLPKEYGAKIEYLFNNIIGYSKHFNCPTIILRDSLNNIVDNIAYRPNKPKNYSNWSSPKYIYKNSHNRGENFLYPFQKEVEKLIIKNDYIVIGEGIKNGLNAILHGVPFITLESTSNSIPIHVIEYIRNFTNKGVKLTCMFDGDKAGEMAYNNFIETSGFKAQNFLRFDSGRDFTEYLMEGN